MLQVGFCCLQSPCEACSVFICILRAVEVNMQIGINEALGYFQSEFTVGTTGKINFGSPPPSVPP